MKRTIIIAILCTLFTGCAQIGKYAQNRFDPMGAAKEECQQLGLQVSTPNYANCVSNLYAAKQNVNAARYNSSGSSDPSPAPAMPRTTTTNCRQVGSSLSCTTF
jgi:hypothetical protein